MFFWGCIIVSSIKHPEKVNVFFQTLICMLNSEIDRIKFLYFSTTWVSGIEPMSPGLIADNFACPVTLPAQHLKKYWFYLGMAFNLNTREADASGTVSSRSAWTTDPVPGQPEPHKKKPCLKNPNNIDTHTHTLTHSNFPNGKYWDTQIKTKNT